MSLLGYNSRRKGSDPRKLLKKVNSNFFSPINYEYSIGKKHAWEKIIKKSLPDNRYLQIQYYEEGINLVGNEKVKIEDRYDARLNRVAALYSPLGHDASPILAWTFKYDLKRDNYDKKPIGGKAEVINALGHKKVYHFTNQQRLAAIDSLFDNGEVYRTEKLSWNYDHDRTRLTAMGLLDGNGKSIFCRHYHYDDEGNVIEAIISGNLTGTLANSSKNNEKFTSKYTYKNGLIKTEDNGRTLIFSEYVKGTNLLKTRLISNKERICERLNYVYDSNGVVIEEIIDDGSTKEISNLTDVTERRIRRIKPTSVQPIGLPEEIREYYLDLSKNKEILLSYVRNIYSKEGYLLEQHYYDSQNVYCYSKKWAYDHFGNLISEVDPLGQITSYTYDKNKNCISKQSPDSSYKTLYTYDYVNRLTKEENVYTNGQILVKNYTYDYLGNKTSSTDIYGNTTDYRYDEFGRLIEKIYPPVLDKSGHLVRYSDKVSYDVQNRPIEKIDTNENIRKFKYTAYGKPYLIEHPNGSTEKSTYHLDGTLEKIIDQYGIETRYAHDYKGRKISAEVLSPQGELLSIRKWIYNAYHLLGEIDPAGNETKYTYDHAGKMIMSIKGTTVTKYFYDSLGRKTETWEQHEPDKYRKTVVQYDNLNRIVKETVKDELDIIYAAKSYLYDSEGNRTHLIIHDNDRKICTETRYNAEKKPVKILHPNGSETTYVHHYNYQNEYGQIVGAVEEIDPKGIHKLSISDSCGRLSKEETRDSQGILLQKTDFIHDGEENQISRIDYKILDGQIKKAIKTEFEYDADKKLITQIEAAGEPHQKVTRKEYSPRGELAKTIKPDGIVITHTYDNLSRLVKLRASDDSVFYEYYYDKNNNIVEVRNRRYGFSTIREFDSNDRMISEILGSGLKFLYKYDSLNRLKQIVYPDGATVNYVYNSVKLSTMQWLNNEIDCQCSYQYYLSGKLAKIALPETCGCIDYRYDDCLRIDEISSKNWSQEIPEEGFDVCSNIVKVIQNDPVGELISTYDYDSLYHLIKETGGANHEYCFDSLHNRICKDGISYEVNVLNQLTQQGDSNYQYDLNGNQKNKTDVAESATYKYDALDRLIAVIYPDRKTEYVYDAFNRRLKKRKFILSEGIWKETDVQNFLYHGEIEVGAVDKEGSYLERRVLGISFKEDIGGTVFIEKNGQVYSPVHDFRGNIVSLLDLNDGQPIECYRYSAYGEEQIFDGYGNTLQESNFPWRFSSKRVDAETNWVFFGRRYYDPLVGKWTTPDPLGFKDGPNLYCFIHNRPMAYIDPDGRLSQGLVFGLRAANAGCKILASNYETWANATIISCMKAYCDDYEELEYQSNYSGVYRAGNKPNDGLPMIFTNGVSNSKDSASQSAEMLSLKYGDREVIYVHNASFGIFDLLVECPLQFLGFITPPSYLLKDTLEEEASKPGFIRALLIGHSQGCFVIDGTSKLCDPELLKKIDVVAVAPAKHMPDGVFGSLIHYESRDIVPWIDRLFGGTLFCGPIVYLTPHPDACLIDHNFNSPTYEAVLTQRILDFLDRYGVQE